MNHSTRFTKENAAEMGRRSAVARSKMHLVPIDQPPPLPAPAPAAQQPIAPTLELSAEAIRTSERMERIAKLMDEAEDPRELDALSRAYDRLFKVWQVQAVVPNPGNRRPAPERSKARQARSEPGQFHAAPQPVVVGANPGHPGNGNGV